MTGIGEFDELRGRHLGEEIRHSLGADNVGKLPADQQDRDAQGHRLALEFLDLHERIVTGLGDELRIPVPMPAAVPVTQILLQALKVAGTLAVRQILGDGIGGLLEGVEAVHVPGHEVADPVAALALEPWHHVDEDEFGHDLRPGVVGHLDPGQAAHARPDQHHRTADLLEDLRDIAGQRVNGVLAVG